MEILAKLGIDWKLLIAQGVNFAILFFVLKRYAYKPMLDFLGSRTERIEQGIKDAEAAKEKLVSVAESEKTILGRARSEAKQMLVEAEQDAKKRAVQREAEAEIKIKQMFLDNEKHLNEERAQMLRDVRDEVVGLVTQSVEKVLLEKVDSAKDQELIERSLVKGVKG